MQATVILLKKLKEALVSVFPVAAIVCLLNLTPLVNFTTAEIAVFLGSSAASIAAANADSIVLVLSTFVIGYSAGRHILNQQNDDDSTLATLTLGLVFAEIAWLCHTWLIVYPYLSLGIRIPQLAVILTVFTFVFSSVRREIFLREDEFKFSDVAMPVIFGVAIVAVILIWFSNPAFNIN